MRNYSVLLLVRAVFATPLFTMAKGHREVPERGSSEFWYRLAISAALVLAGGVFAGCVFLGTCIGNDVSCSPLASLTLGLMGLDELHLRVLSTSSSDLVEKANAKKGVQEPVLNAWMLR